MTTQIQTDFTQAMTDAMTMLAQDPRVVFMGQQVAYPGHVVYETLKHIPEDRRLELPVAEEFQMGFATGLALAGFIPVSVYPRLDFLMLAMNQLVNHLDKLEEMSLGELKPKVIIRTMLGTTRPLNPGPQHSADHRRALCLMLTNIDVLSVASFEEVALVYKQALESPRSTIVVECPPGRR